MKKTAMDEQKKLKTKNKENKSLRTKETETQGCIYFRFTLIISKEHFEINKYLFVIS